MQLVLDEVKRHLPCNGEVRRVFHGRGRRFPGFQDLSIDSYGSLLWLTLFSAREKCWLERLVLQLRPLLPEVEVVVVQRRDLSRDPIEIMCGQLEEQPRVVEDGLSYLLRPNQGQNIGFFIDMREGRRLVRDLSDGKRVLNLFAYSCSFSVAALAGGAEQVVNVDMNKGALALGRKNHLVNDHDLRKVCFLPHEIFRSFSQLRRRGPYDLIICDPPFAQGRSFTAEQHWPKLISRLDGLLAPRGEVIACLNAPHLGADFLRRRFETGLPRLEELSCRTAGEDFPEADPTRGLTIQHFGPLQGGEDTDPNRVK